VPLVILVNGNSASATEIVSGAVQDHDRARRGRTTFGKGLVQTVTPLSENTGLALTTLATTHPAARLIQRDYKSISLYEYHYERKVPEHPTEVKLTDSGRQVTVWWWYYAGCHGGGAEAHQVRRNIDRADVFFPYEAASAVHAFLSGHPPDRDEGITRRHGHEGVPRVSEQEKCAVHRA